MRDVQRIGILDLRLFNTDRHAGNMLVRRPRGSSAAAAGPGGAAEAMLDRGQYELVPIDHGFALPEALEPPYFEWQHWPQAMLPFGREELEYIARLDATADIAMLRAEVGRAGWGGLGCFRGQAGDRGAERSKPLPGSPPLPLTRPCPPRRSPRCAWRACACWRCAPRCCRPARRRA